MSLTRTSSSCPMSNVVVSTSCGVLAQPGEDLGVRRGPPGPGCRAGRPVGVLADRDQQLADGRLDPRDVDHGAACRTWRQQLLGPAQALGVDACRPPAPRRSRPAACSWSSCDARAVACGPRLGGRQHRRRSLTGGARWTARPDAAGASARREDLVQLALPSVSFSNSASTRSSSTSRYSTRISHASSCAASISRRTSSSTIAGDLLGVVALVAHVAAQEHLAAARGRA